MYIILGEDSHGSAGSDCSTADQDAKLSWKSFEEGGGMAGLAAQLALPPSQLEFGQSSVAHGSRGVWTRTSVSAGTRFGPFLGKWVLEPDNEEFAWEVGLRILFEHHFTCFYVML